jgi:hypothetical protein
LKDLKNFFLGYSIIRFIEIVVFGLVQYFIGFRFLTLNQNIIYNQDDLTLEFTRLTGLITFDPVDSAYYLIPVFSIFFYFAIKSKKGNSLFLILLIISSVALVYTWSRSGIIIIILLLIIYYLKRSKIKVYQIVYFGVLFFIVIAYFFYNNIAERFSMDSRLGSNDNFLYRINLYIKFFQNIDKLSLLGSGLLSVADIGYLYTGIKISLENLFLQTFASRGIIVGMMYLIIHFYSLVLFYKNIIK